MNFLIDIGATYIKFAIHDPIKDEILRFNRVPYKGAISQLEFHNLTRGYFECYEPLKEPIKKVFYTTCTGGEFKDGTFYNWIVSNKVGELSPARHLLDGLVDPIYCGPDRELAYLGSGAEEEDLVVNIGTGGQIMRWDIEKSEIVAIKYCLGGWYLEKFDIERNIVYREAFFKSFTLPTEKIAGVVHLTGTAAKSLFGDFRSRYPKHLFSTGKAGVSHDDTLEGLRTLSKDGNYDGKQTISEFIRDRSKERDFREQATSE